MAPHTDPTQALQGAVPPPEDYHHAGGRWSTLWGDPLDRVRDLPDGCANQVWLSIAQWRVGGAPLYDEVQRILTPRGKWVYHDFDREDMFARRAILNWTNPGDLVVDLDLGSGSTGVAALRAGRRFVGIERDPGIYRTAVDRLLWLPESNPTREGGAG